MTDKEIYDLTEGVMLGYRQELQQIFNGDDRILGMMDGLFLIPLCEDANDGVTDDLIDGFCYGLLASDKLKKDDLERVKSIIKSARNLILLDMH